MNFHRMFRTLISRGPTRGGVLHFRGKAYEIMTVGSGDPRDVFWARDTPKIYVNSIEQLAVQTNLDKLARVDLAELAYSMSTFYDESRRGDFYAFIGLANGGESEEIPRMVEETLCTRVSADTTPIPVDDWESRVYAGMCGCQVVETEKL